MEDALTRSNSHIYRALLKNGHSNFSLTILEYCEPEKCLIREKHYWDIFNPEYNIAQDPTAPMSGRTHSDTTKIIMSEAKKGENLSNETKSKISDAHKGKTLSNDTKQKISDSISGKNHPMYGKNHSDESKKKISDAQPTSIKIEVIDFKNNTTTSYGSIKEAARALNIHKSVIDNY
jgi:group I intron endonuclease